jgi:uncharacterized protein YbjT (DUF2867 family)
VGHGGSLSLANLRLNSNSSLVSSMGDPEGKVALLAGGSGLVGGYVIGAILDAPDFARVYAITRRQLNREHFRLANRIVQFDQLETQLKSLKCHVALCCLGTTLRAAGSQAAFRKVDFDYVLAFARAALAAGARRFVLVSSVDANAQSKNFYLRVKGELEAALEKMGFEALDILQPSLLLGLRREMRPAELAMQAIMPAVNPFLTGARERLRAISARTVALAVIGAARSSKRGTNRYTHAGIKALALSKPPPRVVQPPTTKKRANPSGR